MEAKFSDRVKEVISLSREEALRLGHDYIGTEHLVLGMIREGQGVGVGLLKKLGVSLAEVRTSIEQATKGTATSNVDNLANIPLTRQSEKVLKITYLEAKIYSSRLIGTEHLLLSILRDEDNLATQILEKFELDYLVVQELLEYQINHPLTNSKKRTEIDRSSESRTSEIAIHIPAIKEFVKFIDKSDKKDELTLKIKEIKRIISQINREKMRVVDLKEYEKAAALRDHEKKFLEILGRAEMKIPKLESLEKEYPIKKKTPKNNRRTYFNSKNRRGNGSQKEGRKVVNTLFIFDSNIWMQSKEGFFRVFNEAIENGKFGKYPVIKIPSSVPEELENKRDRLKMQKNFAKGPEGKQIRNAFRRIEEYQDKNLLEITGKINFKPLKGAEADGPLLELLYIELQNGNYSIFFINNDRPVLIRAKELSRRSKVNCECLNFDQFNDRLIALKTQNL